MPALYTQLPDKPHMNWLAGAAAGCILRRLPADPPPPERMKTTVSSNPARKSTVCKAGSIIGSWRQVPLGIHATLLDKDIGEDALPAARFFLPKPGLTVKVASQWDEDSITEVIAETIVPFLAWLKFTGESINGLKGAHAGRKRTDFSMHILGPDDKGDMVKKESSFVIEFKRPSSATSFQTTPWKEFDARPQTQLIHRISMANEETMTAAKLLTQVSHILPIPLHDADCPKATRLHHLFRQRPGPPGVWGQTGHVGSVARPRTSCRVRLCEGSLRYNA